MVTIYKRLYNTKGFPTLFHNLHEWRCGLEAVFVPKVLP
jgi:hypothetical protein